MNRRLLLSTAVVLGATGLWWLLRSTGADSAETKPTAHVTVTTLKVAAIAQSLEAFGVVESAPGAERISAAPFDCVISAVRVEPGAHVAAGDVLLEIAPSADAGLSLESARSAQLVAEKALTAAQERFDLKLGTDQDLNLARQSATDARARLKSLEARGLASAGKIRASGEGVVSKIDATRGSLVLMGAPLVAIATVAGLEARLSVEGNARAQLAKNQAVTLSSADSNDSLPVAARVRTVGAVLNPTSGSLDVRVPVPLDAPLMLGEHVRALIEVRQKNAALVVARSAVLPDEGAQVLFTVNDGKAVRHEVAIGIETNDELEVSAPDLAAGALIVTTGNYELTDGMAVQVDKELQVDHSP